MNEAARIVAGMGSYMPGSGWVRRTTICGITRCVRHEVEDKKLRHCLGRLGRSRPYWGVAVEVSRRFESLAGPMSADEFMSGDYPIEKVTRKLREFESTLRVAVNAETIRKEFYRIFTEEK